MCGSVLGGFKETFDGFMSDVENSSLWGDGGWGRTGSLEGTRIATIVCSLLAYSSRALSPVFSSIANLSRVSKEQVDVGRRVDRKVKCLAWLWEVSQRQLVGNGTFLARFWEVSKTQ